MVQRITSDEIRGWLQRDIRKLGSQSELARHIGVTRGYLCSVLKGRKEPQAAVLAYYGLREVVIYERIDAGNRK